MDDWPVRSLALDRPLYWLIAAALLAVALGVAVMVRRGHPPRRDLDPYEVAYLRGGARAAVAVALTALHMDHAIVSRPDGRVQAARSGSDAGGSAGTPLEDAVLVATARATPTPAELTGDRAVRDVLDGVHAELVRQGMLCAPGAPDRVAWGRWPVRGWAAFGFVAAVIGPGIDWSDDLPMVAGIIAFSVAAQMLDAGTGRTVAGRRALRRLQAAEPPPAPEGAQAARGRRETLLGVALHGADALMSTSPEFARTIGLARYLEGSAPPEFAPSA